MFINNTYVYVYFMFFIMLTQKRWTYIFGNLISRSTGLAEVWEFLVEHALELSLGREGENRTQINIFSHTKRANVKWFPIVKNRIALEINEWQEL